MGVVDEDGNVLLGNNIPTPSHGDINQYIDDLTSTIGDLILRLKKLNDNIEIMGIIDEEVFYSPREAINKIIHAQYVGHDIRTDDIKPYYMPSLQLMGNRGNKEWIAEIFLLPFCKILYDFANENDKE